MNIFMQILALLSQLQNLKLVQDIEQCIFTNSTWPAIWSCIVGKLDAVQHSPQDQVLVDAVKKLAVQRP